MEIKQCMRELIKEISIKVGDYEYLLKEYKIDTTYPKKSESELMDRIEKILLVVHELHCAEPFTSTYYPHLKPMLEHYNALQQTRNHYMMSFINTSLNITTEE